MASNHFLQKVNLSKYFIKIKLLTIPVFNFYARDLYLVSSMCFPGGASGKELACQCRRCKRPGFSPWVGKIPLSRAWQATPVFCLENPMDRRAWQATVHRVAQSQTKLKLLSMHPHIFIFKVGFL